MIFSIVSLFVVACSVFIILLSYHLTQYLRKRKIKNYSSYELLAHKIKLETYYVVLMILVALYVILNFTGVI